MITWLLVILTAVLLWLMYSMYVLHIKVIRVSYYFAYSTDITLAENLKRAELALEVVLNPRSTWQQLDDSGARYDSTLSHAANVKNMQYAVKVLKS